MMLYGTLQPSNIPQLFSRLGSWSLLLHFRPASRGCDGAFVTLRRPVAPFTLALLRSALGRFLGGWYFTYQHSSPGAVDRVDDVPALWQVILEYPSGSPPKSRQTFLRPCSGDAVLALVQPVVPYTMALSAALSAGGVSGSSTLQRSPYLSVASSAPLLQGGSSSSLLCSTLLFELASIPEKKNTKKAQNTTISDRCPHWHETSDSPSTNVMSRVLHVGFSIGVMEGL